MDGTLLHRGSSHSNANAAAREVAYVSVLGNHGRPPDTPPPDFALNSELANRHIGWDPEQARVRVLSSAV